MKVCVAGKNKIAVDTTELLISLGIPLSDIGVIFNRNENGINSWQPSFKFYCEQKKIRELDLAEIYSNKELIFFSTEFDKIIKPDKFKSTELFNIHFSTLPAYKGMYTSVMPLLNGENQSGVTLHKIDSGIDTGDIIDQQIFEIKPTTTARGLYDLYLSHATQLIEKNLKDILNKSYQTTPQNKLGSTYYSKSAIDFQKIEIDVHKTAWEIDNQIRAFSFRPYQLPIMFGERVTHANILNAKSRKKPGIIVDENKDTIEMNTIDYNILLFKDRLDYILSLSRNGDILSLDEMNQKGFDIFEKNNKGWDALIVAAFHEQYETCKWLISKGAEVNTINNNGTSPIMYAMTAASKSHNLTTLNILIELGANVHHRDYSGKSLLEYAQETKSLPVLKLLKQYVNQ